MPHRAHGHVLPYPLSHERLVMSRLFAVRRTAALAAALTLTAVGLAACGGSSSGSSDAALAINDSWTRATEGPMTGSFGTLVNSSDQEITITAGASPVAGMVELHEVVMADGEMVMQAKPGGFVVPAGGSLTLVRSLVTPPSGRVFYRVGIEPDIPLARGETAGLDTALCPPLPDSPFTDPEIACALAFIAAGVTPEDFTRTLMQTAGPGVEAQ